MRVDRNMLLLEDDEDDDDDDDDENKDGLGDADFENEYLETPVVVHKGQS
jgi:hypothetical protein